MYSMADEWGILWLTKGKIYLSLGFHNAFVALARQDKGKEGKKWE